MIRPYIARMSEGLYHVGFETPKRVIVTLVSNNYRRALAHFEVIEAVLGGEGDYTKTLKNE